MFDPNETLAQKFIRKGFWLYLFTFLIAPLGYIIKIILARDISQHDFGLFYGILSLITLLSAINDFWCTESLNYFLPKHLIKKEYGKAKYLLRFVFLIQLFTSLSILSFVFLFADNIALWQFHDPQAAEILKIIAFFFLGHNFLQISMSLFSATQNTKLQKWVDFIRMLATVFLTVGIFFLDIWELKLYTYAWIAGVFISLVIASTLAYRQYYVPYFQSVKIEKDPVLRRMFLVYAFPTFLSANIATILSQIDAQLVTKMLWNEAQGLYTNYLSIIGIPFLLITPIVAFLFPVIAELFTRQDTEKMKFLHEKFTLYFIIIGIWVSAFLFNHWTTLATILFGETYRESGIILQFSSFFLIFNFLNQINFQFLSGTGKAWSRTIIFLVTLPINIVLNIVLIKQLGVEGSALAVGISWIPLYVMSTWYTRAYQSIPPISPILKNFIAVLVAVGIVHFARESFLQTEWILFVLFAGLVNLSIFVLVNRSLFQESVKLIKDNRK